MKEVFKQIIKDFHIREIKGIKKRDIDIPMNTEQIISLIGPRRSGKTYVMYYLISQIKDKTDVIYIDFEDDRLGYNWEFQEIIDAYLELYPNKDLSNVYFFLDEVQEVKGWENFVRRIHSSISQNVFITGSSSKLLSKEIATSLRGRSISFEIFPLSFKEYLEFMDIKIDMVSTSGRALLEKELENYILKGGFPEVVKYDYNIRESVLKSYMNTMMFKDMVERYSIANSEVLRRFINILFSRISHEISVNKIYNDMNFNGLKVSKDTLYDYMGYIEDVFMGFRINKLNGGYISKFYSVDLGFNNIMNLKLSQDYGRMIENLVFLHLRRKGYDIFFDKNGFECDFVVKKNEKVICAIQVCSDLNNENIDREIKGVKKIFDRLNCPCFIVNSQINSTKDGVRYISMIEFLLNLENIIKN